MNVIAVPSFHRDLKKMPKKVQLMAKEAHQYMINADNLRSLTNVKKMTGYKNHYRYRIGNYRIGFCIENNSIVLLRLMNRDSIYLVFP